MQQEMMQKQSLKEAEAKKKEKEAAEKAEAQRRAEEERKKSEEARQLAEKKKAEEEEKKKQEAFKLAEQKKAAEEKAKKEAAHKQQVQKFEQELDQFSVTLNKKHFEAALKSREEAKKTGDEPKLNVHTSEVYRKSFTFPQIANNDYAVEQFEYLSVAEQNLNADPANEMVMENFLKVADEVASNLKERYKD